MLSNWFSQPEGSGHSSADEGRIAETDEDTQVMEPNEGNGKLLLNLDFRWNGTPICARLGS